MTQWITDHDQIKVAIKTPLANDDLGRIFIFSSEMKSWQRNLGTRLLATIYVETLAGLLSSHFVFLIAQKALRESNLQKKTKKKKNRKVAETLSFSGNIHT